jgi:hypothetical protein
VLLVFAIGPREVNSRDADSAEENEFPGSRDDPAVEKLNA